MTSERLQVLLVEDSRAHAAVVRAHLDGQVDIDHVRDLSVIPDDARYDMVLLDLNLPTSNGDGTIVRARERFPDCPIIVITSNESACQKATGCGDCRVDGCFVKGQYHPDSLVARIRQASVSQNLKTVSDVLDRIAAVCETVL